jgi:glycosyltransferase involved in cell wall biosynthesis
MSVQLITSGACHGWWQADTLSNVPVIRLRKSQNTLLTCIWFNMLSLFWWVGHARAVDVVHIHGCTHLTTLVWIILARLWRKKSLLKITCSGVDDLDAIGRYPMVGRLAVTVARKANGFIALTPEIARQLMTHVAEERVFLIPNGVDTTCFYPNADEESKRALRQALDLPQDMVMLLYTGGINPRKNVAFLLDVLATVRHHPQAQESDRPDANLFLCLVGPCKSNSETYGQHLQNRIHALGLDQWVFMPGEVQNTDISCYLRAADIFVFASRQEGLPSSPIEAMACGLPTVMAELPGVTDWLYPTGTSFATVVPQDNVQAFAAAIRVWLTDLEKRRDASKQASDEAARRFAISAIARHYIEKVYSGLFG